WKGGGDDAFTLLFVSSARPAGAYSMSLRASSLMLHLGPSEAWNAALRVGVTQNLMQAWIGGELHFGEGPNLFLHAGLSPTLAAPVLFDLDLLTPDDAKSFADGLLSIQATSPYHGKTNAELAQMSEPAARATLVARGALYALRLEALLAAKKKMLPAVLLPL